MSSTRPAHPRVLAVVQAGGKGSRMDVLTRERAKPVLPYAGRHRLIDVVLSNLTHSGIVDVWVSVQFQAGSLDSHLAQGRPWNLDRTGGGLRRMVPEEGSGSAAERGFSHGNADDLYRMRDEIARHGADVVVVASADHVFRLDLRDVIDQHLDRDAECTVVTAEVGKAEASHNVVVSADQDGRVTDVVPKPAPSRRARSPRTRTVATEIFVYGREVLVAELERLRRERLAEAAREGEDTASRDVAEEETEGVDTGLGDFGDHLLPAFVARGRAFTYPLPGYWADLGRPTSYLRGHLDLVGGKVDVFDDPSWPVLGVPPSGPAGWIRAGAEVVDAMIGPGCEVRGTVVRSVLGPGVVVRQGAHVEDCVLMDGVLVEKDASVSTAVLDERVRVGRGAVVGEPTHGKRLRSRDVSLIGADAIVRRGATLPPGTRMEPGSTT